MFRTHAGSACSHQNSNASFSVGRAGLSRWQIYKALRNSFKLLNSKKNGFGLVSRSWREILGMTTRKGAVVEKGQQPQTFQLHVFGTPSRGIISQQAGRIEGRE
mmetsp:Transcript_24716/g.57610  ORF Transcript_24716/g.57610 Transcript_24716/m.57610 type:complete len:104 (-) Transcript_24716:3329-3640(-)